MPYIQVAGEMDQSVSCKVEHGRSGAEAAEVAHTDEIWLQSIMIALCLGDNFSLELVGQDPFLNVAVWQFMIPKSSGGT